MTDILIVALIVTMAAAYVGRRAWVAAMRLKRAKDAHGCGSDCGCSDEH